MNHVVVNITPFVMKQNITVFVNGEVEKTVQCDISELEKVSYALCKEYDVHKLECHGLAGMAAKMQRELNKSTEFSDFQIIVEEI